MFLRKEKEKKEKKKSLSERIKLSVKNRSETMLDNLEERFEDYVFKRLVEEFERLMKE